MYVNGTIRAVTDFGVLACTSFLDIPARLDIHYSQPNRGNL